MAHIFFDHNSTTALRPQVLESMMPFLIEQQGNATSRHSYGRTARAAVEHAREQVADAVNAHPSQVVFTASGTEANNFAVLGITTNLGHGQILISAVEHPCVSRPALAMQSRGWQALEIGVNADCSLDMHHLHNLLSTPTNLVSVMLVNNETGTIQDLPAIADLAVQNKAFVHSDAVQALGKIPLSFADLNVHAMTVSSHKIGGPLGAGALIMDKRLDIQPLLHGGGQEKGLRSGTENLAAIVGFGAACELAINDLKEFAAHTKKLRDLCEVGLIKLGAHLFANHTKRVNNTSFFAFPNIDGETLVMALDRKGFAVASGSACSSDSGEPSHVLLAMGVDAELARGAVRVSFGLSNTLEQVQQFLTVLENELIRLRGLVAAA